MNKYTLGLSEHASGVYLGLLKVMPVSPVLVGNQGKARWPVPDDLSGRGIILTLCSADQLLYPRGNVQNCNINPCEATADLKERVHYTVCGNSPNKCG